MIVDSSAIVAVLLRERGFDRLLEKMLSAESLGVGSPALAETGIVLTARLPSDARGILARFLAELSVVTIPFGDAHWRESVNAYRRFGKGRHPAGLNFGDCLTYATAKLAAQPLLCTGDDFSKTDIEIA
ncbi:MAG: type II toxin-antitoxin system VapC family toxin [Acidobacteria bacterium]|nr:type II toxin-antitoxin system VapC family toxin [Acidobacteriota bacterium]